MNTFFSAGTMKSVVHQMPAKLAASAGVMKLAEAMGVHLQLCFLFVLVMFLDLLTRYLAQSAKLWHDLYPQTPGTIYDYWRFRVQARKWRYFKSAEMRKKTISKIGTYGVILAAMSVCDVAMMVARFQPFLLSLTTAFLSCTEACSILENLQECGFGPAQSLFDIIKKRKDAIK